MSFENESEKRRRREGRRERATNLSGGDVPPEIGGEELVRLGDLEEVNKKRRRRVRQSFERREGGSEEKRDVRRRK